MTDAHRYRSPLVERYASPEMAENWGDHKKFSTWRRLWLALAEAQQELGLPISDAQLNAIRGQLDTLDLDLAAKYERELRHDVMAHVHALGDAAPCLAPRSRR